MVKRRDLAKETFIVTSHGSGREVRATAQDLLPRGHTPGFAADDVCQEGMSALLALGLACRAGAVCLRRI